MRIAAALLALTLTAAPAAAAPATYSSLANIRAAVCGGDPAPCGAETPEEFIMSAMRADSDAARLATAPLRVSDQPSVSLSDTISMEISSVDLGTLIAAELIAPEEETETPIATPLPGALPLALTGMALLGFAAARRNRA